MSDHLVMGVVVFAALLLVSYMLVARLQWASAPAARTNLLVAELWLVAAVMAALLVAMSRALGPAQPAAPGLEGELRDLGGRLAALSAESKWVLGAGAAAALALFVHLLYSISKTIRAAPP